MAIEQPQTTEDHYAYKPETLPEHLRWQGDGPPPPRWMAADGTIVYRSYGDYCDD